ncbi:MAG: helix-turn-helix transcriptional regulator [Bradyrhizobiaceae bacterium]|nr:helix-turn-helix transcriptional regulator [Bradyrhizobiaceae bacterium]
MESGIRSIAGDHTQHGDGDVEQELGWTSGSALMKTQVATSSCQRDFIRTDLAVGVLFQAPGSEVTWELDGKSVLGKVWSGTTVSHDLVILPPGCEFHARCRGSGQGLWLFVDPRSVASDVRVQSFLKRATVNCSWTKDKLAWMIACEIRKECQNNFPRGPMFLESAAMTFISQLAYIIDGAICSSKQVRALSDEKLKYIIDYIDDGLHRNITLAELSALVQLTPRYFCSAFKEAMGRPPHQYLIEQRIERARTLLQHPGLSLTEVALTLGFNSQSHLNSHFRRIVGLTPARYRHENQSNRTVIQGFAAEPPKPMIRKCRKTTTTAN